MIRKETILTPKHMQGRIAAFFDFDGTLTCLDSFFLLGLVAGWKRIGRVSLLRFFKALTDYQRNRLTNRELKETVLSGLEGLSHAQMNELCSRLFQYLIQPSIRPGLKARIDQHNRAGHVTVLLSASLEEQLLPAAEFLQVAEIIGTKARYSDGKLTGRLEGEACHGEEKARLAKAFCESRGIHPGESCAYGNSLPDLPVLDLCGHACVVNGDGKLRRIAKQRGWEILHCSTPFLSLIEGLAGVHRV